MRTFLIVLATYAAFLAWMQWRSGEMVSGRLLAALIGSVVLLVAFTLLTRKGKT